MSLAIRRASLDDLDLVAPLFDAYRRFYSQPGDLRRARARSCDARLQRDESVIFLAELDDGTAAGFTQLYPMFSSVRTARLWVLNDLFVATARDAAASPAPCSMRRRQFARDDGRPAVSWKPRPTTRRRARCIAPRAGRRRYAVVRVSLPPAVDERD